MSARTIYGSADLAELFGVSRAAVTNWHTRCPDAPAPDFMTLDGRRFWLSLDPWIEWVEARQAEAERRKLRRARDLERRARTLRRDAERIRTRTAN